MQKEISKVNLTSSTRKACLQGCLGWCLGTWILLRFPPALGDKRLALPKLCKQYGLCWTPAFLQGVSNWRLCQAEAACVTGPLYKTLDVESLTSSLSDNISTSSHVEKSLLEVSCVSDSLGTAAPSPEPVPGLAQSVFSILFLIAECLRHLFPCCESSSWQGLHGCPLRKFPNLGVFQGALSMQCWISYL